MLLLPASAALLFFRRPHFNYLRTCRAGIWLLPLIPLLLFPAPPFPRVFFPLFPLFMLLTAAGIRDFTAIYCRLKKRYNSKSWFAGLLILSVSWCCIQQQPELKRLFSDCCGGPGRDDFYLPYYLRPSHMPEATARMAARNEEIQQNNSFYFTFDSDPWPLMFYLRLNGFTGAPFLFDGPRGMIRELPRCCTVILKKDESQQNLEKRFGGQWKFLFSNENHQLWSCRL